MKVLNYNSDNMKTKDCKECKKCKSKNILITTDLDGTLIAATCIDCGWAFESSFFKKMMTKFDDPEFKIDVSNF